MFVIKIMDLKIIRNYIQFNETRNAEILYNLSLSTSVFYYKKKTTSKFVTMVKKLDG